MKGFEQAQKLGNQVLADPSLLNQLDEDTFIKFVISLSKHDKPLAQKVFYLKSADISAQSKILFWEAVDLLLEIDYSLAG
jgi:hypothetical protein